MLKIKIPINLLIFFVYPVWESIKKIRAVKISLKGINAVAGGMITAAALILMQANGYTIPNFLMTFLTVAILATKKVPAPLVVFIALIAGAIVLVE